MRAAHEPVTDGRRSELGDFLRRRRAELTTDIVGLPATRRRRTPGLRREEVAELANISTALYSWLEQGRDVPISRRTVDAIAAALQFAPSERDHIYALATHETLTFAEDISPTLERMVGSLRSHPVFVIDHTWDVVMINRASHVVFNYEGGDVLHMNLLRATFERGRELFANWHEVASSLVELFRYDYALYATDAKTLALVDELLAADNDFRSNWEGHRVRRSPSAVRELAHPLAGTLRLEPSIYAVIESPGLRCMIYTPNDDETESRIGRLVADAFGDCDAGCGALFLR